MELWENVILTYLRSLEDKKEQVLKSIEEQGKLTRFLPGKSASIAMQNHDLRECQRYGATGSKPGLFADEQ